MALNEGRNFSSGNTASDDDLNTLAERRSMRAGTLVPATRALSSAAGWNVGSAQ